ncbi:LLM class flavin-dependent oxidoreductase [Streptomyces adustus]|uniref:LLM class flavin-dependent oxidoreductase n=1 Tax=Streptomyces adustus TaxID=1609272 RepID=A0A5N8VIZ5_9ACTN|nr:LLM class flavin-dependent oxidoreductase [Streptomyces adustus]
MVQSGYTMVTEQAGVRDLADHVVGAERAGFLSQGRFRLGLGSGENLNEHVVGRGRPTAEVRHEMFEEAVCIIRDLFEGGHVSRGGRHFAVDSARLWDLPPTPPPLGIAVSGEWKVDSELPHPDSFAWPGKKDGSHETDASRE